MNYVVTRKQGWFSRIGGSIKGFFFGLLLVLGAIGLLAWNEHRTVKTRKGLQQGEKVTLSVPADRVDVANAGKLVHLTGTTQTASGSRDTEFDVSRNALSLKREAQMYQWREKKTERKEKNLGGGETTVTEYSYSKVWDDDLIDSSNFQQPSGHSNPGSMPVRSQRFDAADAAIGAFALNSGQIGSIGGWRAVAVSEVPYAKRGGGWRSGNAGGLYMGADPAQPQVGDVRVTFEELPVGPITVIAAQEGAGFKAWTTPNGVEIDLLEDGSQTIPKMFENAQSSNATMGWILRGVGFLMMWMGFGMTLNPLRVLADVIPFVGRIVGAAGGLLSFLLAAILASVVIIISWLFVRPLLVIAVVAGGIGLFMLIGQLRARKVVPQSGPGYGAAPGYVQPSAPGAYIPDPPSRSVPPGPPPPPPFR
jgi:hypothetical protein